MNGMRQHEVGAAVAAGATQEFLTFRLGPEHYGIHILKVQEIRGYDRPTVIANAPPFIKGVVNLRGVIVPVLDLRIRFGLPDPKYDQGTVVIVLNIGERVIGIVVDAVSDVVPLPLASVQPPPDFASELLDTKYITGLATVEDQLLILLDIERLMTGALADQILRSVADAEETGSVDGAADAVAAAAGANAAGHGAPLQEF
jgi:purine-binding chemotaxis protein CheW